MKKVDKENRIISKKKSNLKKVLLIIGILLLSIIIVLVVIFGNKQKDVDDIKVSELNYVVPLSKEDEVRAAKIIKDNIAKITNQIDENTSIVGTGFFIDEGYLVTNSHIVDIMGNITIEYNDGLTTSAYLYSNSIKYDIALLKVEDVRVKALSFGNSTNKDITNEVLAAGYLYNFAGEATISKGFLSARRYVDSFTFLQSDISIDTGSSGGPLFDATAAVIGINVYATKNKTFAISISSESMIMIIDALLESPTIEYLTEARPSNSINAMLVEVGYTEDINLDLYNDLEKIRKSKKEHKEELEEEAKKENVITSDDSNYTESYYCDVDYMLVGEKCVKQTTYNATNNLGDCKSGYTKNGNQCTRINIVDATAEYECYGTLTEDKTCIEDHLWESGFASYSSRLGSCPKGKSCFDEGTEKYYNTGRVVIDDMVCPTGSTKIYTGTKIVWSNEGVVPGNFKTWTGYMPGLIKRIDTDGLVYYEDISNVLALCAKSYDSKNNVYITYTYDELKSMACPNGSLLRANTNNQGFYCKINETPHLYSWDVSCKDPSYNVMTRPEGSTIICGKWIQEDHNVIPSYSCKEGVMREDQKTCSVEEIYILPDNYTCNSGDTLNGTICLKTEITSARKN